MAPELGLGLDRALPLSLREQVEARLRAAIQSGALAPGTRLPSTRLLADDLGLSRGVVVEAYAQLTAEGYLDARSGSATRVAAYADLRPAGLHEHVAEAPRPRYSFRPGVPDLGQFPRNRWVASVRAALRTAPDPALSYGDPRGPLAARAAVCAYLGRVRGVVTDPERIVICTGFTQGLTLIAQVLRAAGHGAIAVEDPCHPEQRMLVEQAGLRAVPVAVDDHGLRVDQLETRHVRAVLVSPAHQFPLGVVMSPARRAALLDWARRCDGLVIEDDYDAEFRYDRAPVGALQGLAPERVLHAGSASKMLAPALRIGWIVLPGVLTAETASMKYLSDLGSPAIEGLAFAHFLQSGSLDHHLRRVRLRYRSRRDALVTALSRHLPGARIRGIAAGLHAVVDLPAACDEEALVDAAARQGMSIFGLRSYYAGNDMTPPALVLGYAALSEAAIATAVAELGRLCAATIRAPR